MTKKKNKPNKVREYNDWYWGGRVSEEIKDTKINYRKYQQFHKQVSNIEAYKKSIYDKYNIKQYKNKQEYIDKHKDYIGEEEANKRWKDYQHRDILISSGQYDEIRIHQYQESYATKLRKAGYPEDVAHNIEKLTPKQFNEIMLLPNADKTSLKSSVLPDIGNFQYRIKGVMYLPEDTVDTNIGDIMNVFNKMGYQWDEPNAINAKKVLSRLRYKFVPKEHIEDVIDDEGTEIYIDSIVSFMSDEQVDELLTDSKYRNKRGEFYIKGIGSTTTRKIHNGLPAVSQGLMTRFRIALKNKHKL